ncbi:hypothetical protein COE14_29685 [Bacillus thuringiensis]|nr:hypothetical protein COE14_29685 [Bacillus thuringiensis]
MGVSPQELNVTEYGISLLFRTIVLAIRRVQLLIRVEQLYPVFGLFGLAKAKNPPKKVPQGQKSKRKGDSL